MRRAKKIADTLTMKPLGSFEVTHYSYTGRLTKNGSKPTDITIAVDPGVIPLNSIVYVPGYGLKVAQDTGNPAVVCGNIIDVYVPDHDEAVRLGRLEGVKVWIVK